MNQLIEQYKKDQELLKEIKAEVQAKYFAEFGRLIEEASKELEGEGK